MKNDLLIKYAEYLCEKYADDADPFAKTLPSYDPKKDKNTGNNLEKDGPASPLGSDKSIISRFFIGIEGEMRTVKQLIIQSNYFKKFSIDDRRHFIASLAQTYKLLVNAKAEITGEQTI